MGKEWRARDAHGRVGRVSQWVDKKWIQFRHEDVGAGEEVILSALALPGSNGRELLVKIISLEKRKIWKSDRG